MATRAKVTYVPNKFAATHIYISGSHIAVIEQAHRIIDRKSGWKFRDPGDYASNVQGSDKSASCWLSR